MGFVYKISNIINNKEYVGMTIGKLQNRIYSHFKLKNSGAPYLKQAIKKYGEKAFKIEVIDTADNKDDLAKKEIYWIKTLNTQIPNGYNVQPGGTGGRNQKSIEKHNIPVICLDTGERFASMTEGALRTGATAGKISLVCKGKRDTSGGLRWRYVDDKAHALAEQRAFSRKNTRATKDKRSKSGRAGAMARAKKIICAETGENFDSVIDAAKKYGLERANINMVLKGKQNKTGNLSFYYVDKNLRELSEKTRQERLSKNKKSATGRGLKIWETRRRNKNGK